MSTANEQGDVASAAKAVPARRPSRKMAVAGAMLLAPFVIGLGLWKFDHGLFPIAHSRVEPAQRSTPRASDGSFIPSSTQWASLAVETVAPRRFRSIVTTDGRIAIDEDNTTPVFSPYAGRVVALHVKAGDRIEVGQPLFTIAATDMVQAQNDMVNAIAGLNKANSALRLAEVNLTRARNLFELKAGSQRDFQTAEDARNAAIADKSAGEAALQAARNRLRLLGKTDEEITVFQKEGRISSETVIPSPLSGTVVLRKVGPGQFVGGAGGDPVFIIGDLSTVWAVANVKETDAPFVDVGQPIEFRVLAFPGKTFKAKLSYVAATVDPSSRRLTVRAEIPNPDGKLKPEMFAMVDIVTSGEQASPSIPRGSLIYEGENAHVWIVGQNQSVAKRPVKVGTATTDRVQIIEGLNNGDVIVARGSLFIDRLATAAAQ